MHGLRCESLSQLCFGFGIQLRVSGWSLFGRITGHSRFTCLRVLYVSYGYIRLCSFIMYSGLVLFELKSTRNEGFFSG